MTKEDLHDIAKTFQSDESDKKQELIMLYPDELLKMINYFLDKERIEK